MIHRDVYGDSSGNSYACSSETLGLLQRLEELQQTRERLLVELGRRMGELEGSCVAKAGRSGFFALRKRILRKLVYEAREEGATDLVPLLSSAMCAEHNKVSGNCDLGLLARDDDIEGGGRFYERSSLAIGLIADEFNVRYLSDAFPVILLNPDNYREMLSSNAVDLVLYMSSWRGAGYVGGVKIAEAAPFYGPAGRFLARTILEFARSCDVPTVFQSIEDPPSYKVFLDVARSADYVFTSCVEMVDRYKEDTENSRVFVAKYGVNPAIHNPIGMFRIIRREAAETSVLFAGAWYKRFKSRCRDMTAIFDGVLSSPSARLFIIDRNLRSSERGDGRIFPSRYAECLYPPVEYRALQQLHKLFDWTVNVNSVTNSATMCARRLYEVQALGCPVLSNESKAVEEGFPSVFQIREPDEVARILRGYTRRELMNMRIEAVRSLFSGCTVYDRMNELFELIGMTAPFSRKPVHVLCRTLIGSVQHFLETQTYSCVPVSVDTQCEGTPISADISEGYFIWFDALKDCVSEWADNPHYVEDLVNAFKFADCSYVRYASDAESDYAYEFEVASNLYGPALFDAAQVSVDEATNGSVRKNLRGFVIAREQWGRDTASASKHLGVIVPVFRNVDFLWKRCIRSLLRSSVFERMRLHLVNCLPVREQEALHRLAAAFDNVDIVPFESLNGEGRSAACAAGVLSVSEPYFTFLDPEDEAVGDGFAKLLSLVQDVRSGVAAGVAKPTIASRQHLRRRQIVERMRRRVDERYSSELRGAVFSTDRFASIARNCLKDNVDFDDALARAARLRRRARLDKAVVYIGSKEVLDVGSKRF